jgi:hypothetical protein
LAFFVADRGAFGHRPPRFQLQVEAMAALEQAEELRNLLEDLGKRLGQWDFCLR